MHSDVTPPTPRELEVLDLICQAYSSKEIAHRLGISFKTVACHRTHLMEKADVHDPISLFRWAICRGYVTIDGQTTENLVGARIPHAEDTELRCKAG